MNTIHHLEEILNRLKCCPLNLVRVELDMFNNDLDRNIYLTTILTDIIKRNEQVLGPKAYDIAKDVRQSLWTNLGFANSAPLRAAVGYQVLKGVLYESNWEKCAKTVCELGAYYAGYKGIVKLTQADMIRVFSEVFLNPLVSYLGGALETKDQIVLLLSRYKQRSEWFPDPEFIKAAQDIEGGLEKRLRTDFMRYLFDNGVAFTVETHTPSGGGEADILPVLPDLGPIPIETKVYDGKSRDISYVSRGIAQTADYALRFNSTYACYIVFNVAENTRLSLAGTLTTTNVIRIPVNSIEVFTIVADLCITITASKASKLKLVSVPIPTTQHNS